MAEALPIALAVAGTAMSAGGTILGAKNEASALTSEADQLDAQAGVYRASSQREAMEQRRQATLTGSRALTLAAASGGGASDPTVMNILANISGEGEYRALTALYDGEEKARSNEFEAGTRRKEAKNTKTAGYIKAGSTILSAGATMADRYG